ncbi:hypothetical protein [Eoetvoesiella caeni]|uniref:Uncharacterized protein n=1 Tax=Eoetvoesiella caeni TaxID=645616 RepID=A0A366HDG8_9BURK|nr:hypothetical protein [Eoetvoesiella caeni]MCI2809354.1 hypothetical protein [Eoetvoesiella caeni]NYT54495.1 hypothetical protein [Eoetvoesiella caeni]RBP39316.1 hypothetical protein DFR37_105108 [Eoetvoesiella caeni]
MGHIQHRQPEPPITPPELPHGIHTSAESIYKQTLNAETRNAIVLVRQILVTGQGHLQSVDSQGRYVNYDAGDLWDVLTENEESADLRIFAGLALSPDSAFLRTLCDQFLGTRIAPFIKAHAELMAAQAERVYLVQEGY